MTNDTKDALLCAAVVIASIPALTFTLTLLGNRRPPISNHATWGQVLANFQGRPDQTGHYLSGYTCAGYTAGAHGHGWVVIRCRK